MKVNMTIDECLAFADEWSRGMTVREDSQGWRVACMLLAEEVRRLRAEVEDLADEKRTQYLTPMEMNRAQNALNAATRQLMDGAATVLPKTAVVGSCPGLPDN